MQERTGAPLLCNPEPTNKLNDQANPTQRRPLRAGPSKFFPAASAATRSCAGGTDLRRVRQGLPRTDLEGVTRIDFSNNMASLIHGHAAPAIIDAVTEQMHRGTAFSFGNRDEVRYAEHLCARPALVREDSLRELGHGGDHGRVKAARAFTGRPEDRQGRGRLPRRLRLRRGEPGLHPATWGDATIRAAFRWCTGRPSPRSRTSLSFRSTTRAHARDPGRARRRIRVRIDRSDAAPRRLVSGMSSLLPRCAIGPAHEGAVGVR